MGESGIRRCLKLGAVGSCETAFPGAATVYVNGCQGEGGRPKLTYTEGAVGASAVRCSRRDFLHGSLALAGLGLISACGVLPPKRFRAIGSIPIVWAWTMSRSPSRAPLRCGTCTASSRRRECGTMASRRTV